MSKRYLFAAFLGGISLAMGSALLASSAWLLSSASLRPPILTLEVAIVAVRFFGLSRGVFRYAERLVSHDAAFEKLTKSRLEIFEIFLRLPIARLYEYSRGGILQSLTAGLERREDFYLRIMVPWLSSLIAGVSGLGILTYLVPSLGRIAISLFLATITVLPALGYLNSHTQGKREVAEEALSRQIVSTIEARDEALLFNYVEKLRIDVSENVSELKRFDFRESFFTGIGLTIIMLSAGVTTLFAIFYTFTEIATHGLAPVNFAVSVLLPLSIFDSASSLPAAFSSLGDVLQARKSLRNIEAQIPQVNVQREKTTQIVGSQLVLQGFTPSWGTDSPQIPPLSTILERGQSLLLTGKSGSGKSSIALAIAGLLEYQGGAQIDGIDIESFDEVALNTLITLAPQDDYLFSTSIRENLKIGDSNATDPKIEHVLKLLELSELLQSLPAGLNTHVGRRGINFSGGEQRRLLLARALLRSTPFYILDEPFEFLDQPQIERLAPRILDYLKGSAVIVISHLPVVGVDREISLANH